MEVDPAIITGVGGAGGVAGLAVWAFKSFVNRVLKRFDIVDEKLASLTITQAKDEGKFDVLWREMNSKGDRITVLEQKVDRAWDSISKLAQPRISDLLDKELK